MADYSGNESYHTVDSITIHAGRGGVPQRFLHARGGSGPRFKPYSLIITLINPKLYDLEKFALFYTLKKPKTRSWRTFSHLTAPSFALWFLPIFSHH